MPEACRKAGLSFCPLRMQGGRIRQRGKRKRGGGPTGGPPPYIF